MTTPDPTLTTPEAREAAFADWYVLQDADQVDARAGWDAGWAAAVAWAVGYMEALAKHDPNWFTDRYALRAVASLLRQEGGGTYG